MTDSIVYIHNRNIMHRDINTVNFLVFDNNGILTIKLCDFGAARE